jgi:hypothetical protein
MSFDMEAGGRGRWASLLEEHGPGGLVVDPGGGGRGLEFLRAQRRGEGEENEDEAKHGEPQLLTA